MKKIHYILVFLLFYSKVFAQYPTLLKDINTVGNSSPSKFCTVNTIVFFMHDDEVHGYELWRTDGTDAGTYMVKDINAGYGSSLNYETKIVEFNGMAFFNAKNSTNGSELWKSDGTENGTVMVSDIVMGSGGSSPSNLTVCGNYLMFVAGNNNSIDGINGKGLWKTDGTSVGTTIVSDITIGVNQGFINEIFYVPSFFSATIYFTISNSTVIANNGIWHTSYSYFGGGNLSMPSKITGTENASNLTTFNFSLFFLKNSRDLYKYDGTNVTLIKQAIGGTYNPANQDIFVFNNAMYYTGYDTTNGWELWKSDGTTAGTAIFKNISTDITLKDSQPYGYTICNNVLYFSAYDSDHGYELWKTDGTTAGTVLVNDIEPGATGSDPSLYIADGTKLYFLTIFYDSDYTKFQVRMLETSNSQLSLLKDFGQTRGEGGNGIGSALLNHTLILTGYDFTNGFEVWKSDGSVSGTVMVKDISKGNLSAIDYLSVGSNTFFASFDDDTYSYKPYVSNGTAAGTFKLADIGVIINYSHGNTAFINLNGTVYFGAVNETNGSELWKTNGTVAGTVLFKDINTGPNYSYPFNFCIGNGTLYFSADDGTNGTELWKTDGTSAGTVMIKNINVSPSIGSSPANLTYLNGYVYFSAFNGANHSLWKSDGTDAGTTLVKTFNNISSASFMVFNNKIYFSADDNVNGFELWSSDGTLAGTTLLKNIYVGTNNSSYPENLTSNSSFSKFYFTADNGINGRELWVSDGTSAGTILINICPEFPSFPNPIPQGSNPQSLTFAGNLLLFSAYKFDFSGDKFGRELWRSGGTVASTTNVKDINLGVGQGGISDETDGEFPTVGGNIYFPANDGSNGVELWKSNGTAAGTSMVNDLYLGNNNDGLTPKGEMHAAPSGQVFFEATNGQIGRELWSFQFCPTNLTLNTTVQTNSQKQQAFTNLTSTSNIANTGLGYGNLDVLYTAGKSLTFLPGFQVDSKQLYPLVAPPQYRQTVFKAEIGGCH